MVLRGIVYHDNVCGVFRLLQAFQATVYPSFKIIGYYDNQYFHAFFVRSSQWMLLICAAVSEYELCIDPKIFRVWEST